MPENLTPKQRQAVAALLETPTVATAARTVGVSRETVYKWLKQDAFVQAVQDAEAERLQAVQRGLLAGAEGALIVILNLLRSDSESVRLRASIAILEQVIRLRELTTLEARLAALESRHL